MQCRLTGSDDTPDFCQSSAAIGYEIMRIDPQQPWHPVWLAQPLFNLLLTVLFEWGVAVHDIDFQAVRAGDKSWAEVRKDLKGISGKARAQIIKDYLGWPAISAGAFALAQLARVAGSSSPRSRGSAVGCGRC